jgi:hypothetical protein
VCNPRTPTYKHACFIHTHIDNLFTVYIVILMNLCSFSRQDKVFNTSSCEYIVANPCSGSLFLSATSALFREEIQREHTATIQPKPTEENGLPPLPRGQATVLCNQRVVFDRCAVWNDIVEADLVAKTARIRFLCEDAKRKGWPEGAVMGINDAVPLFYSFDGEVHLILFAKHLVQGMPHWWGTPEHSVCPEGSVAQIPKIECTVGYVEGHHDENNVGLVAWNQFCAMSKPQSKEGPVPKHVVTSKKRKLHPQKKRYQSILGS